MATPASNEVQNIFGYIKESGEGSQRLLLGAQNALLQTRQLQLQEQAQIFNQGLNLRKQDFIEKQQVFENGLANVRLGMQMDSQVLQDALTAERIKTQEELTSYHGAKASQLAAVNEVDSNTAFPYYGSLSDIVKWGGDNDGAAQQLTQDWGSDLDTVVGSMALPSDTGGSNTGTSLWDDPSPFALAGGAAANLAPQPSQITKKSVGAAMVAQRSEQSRKPTSDFQRAQEIIGRNIARVGSSDLPQQYKREEVQRMQQSLLMAATEVRDTDPMAQKFLTMNAPQAEAIYNAAASGNDAVAKQWMEEATSGFKNPVIIDAYVNGNKEYQRRMQREAEMKERDQLIGNIQRLKEAGLDASLDENRYKALTQKLYGEASPDSVGATNESLRPTTPRP